MSEEFRVTDRAVKALFDIKQYRLDSKDLYEDQ